MNAPVSKKSKNSFRFYTALFRNGEFGRYGHLQLRIVLVLNGTLEMQIGGKHYEIHEGWGVFIPSLEAHSFHSPTENSFRVIEFSRENLDSIFSFAKGMKVTRHVFKFSDAVRRTIAEYADFNGFCEDAARISAILAPLAYEVREGCEFSRATTDVGMLMKILNYVEERFCERIDLVSVGAALGVHPASVSRIISKSTGGTFNNYLRHVRCVYAAKQITLGNMTFAEIAFASGFGSIRSFNRAFRDVYSMTPQEYRESFIRKLPRQKM